MSLQYIPFQPLYFGELPDDCCTSPTTGTCKDVAGVGGLYANLAQYNDVTQFQLVLGLCGDATQLVTNPNFSGTAPEQLVEDPTFNNGLDEFDNTSGSWTAGTNEISLSGNGTLDWDIPAGGTNFLRLRLTISDIDGTLEIMTSGTNPEFDTAGTYDIVIDMSSESDVDFTFTGTSLSLTLFEIYSLPQVSDWQIQGFGYFENGIATIIGTPVSAITQSALTANTTYLVELNVIELSDEGTAAVSLGLSESASAVITETGVQQFILTTDSSPFIGVVSSGDAQISVEYIKAYVWFEPDDITVEIIPYGSNTAVATLGDGSKYISTDSLTVSIDWDEILADDNPLPEGLYYIRVTDCDGSLDSQPINLATSHACTFALRACMDNDALGFDFEAFSPFIRLVATFSQPKYRNPDRLQFIDTRDRVTNAFSVVNKTKLFETDDLPEYVLDFLGTLSAYSTIWLGSQQYVVDNPSIEPDSNAEFPTWGKAEIEFRMVNYPLRSVRCASEVKDCSPPPNCWLWPDGSPILWEDDLNNVCIRYN